MNPEVCLVLAAPAALLAAALFSHREPGPRPRTLPRVLSVAAGLGVLVSAASALAVALRGAVASPLLGVSGLGFSLHLDALSATLFLMVALLAVVILRFSNSYLDGDARQGRFLGNMALAIASVEMLVLSGNIAQFFLAWVATSFFLQRLLTFYAERRGAVIAGRKKYIVARLADAALFTAFALLFATCQTGDLTALFSAVTAPGARESGTVLEIAAALLALAALLKSAQFPTHGWLMEMMETPTPVSALLHAGILNAGPFLALRFATLFNETTFAPSLLVFVGGITALFASTVLLTQPSVKVGLAYSSAAHMGFSLFVCGLGVYSAAVLHLVAHSFYKAHAFLASGSAVEFARASRIPAPGRLRSPARMIASVVLALALYAGIAALLAISPWQRPGELIVGAILVLGLSQLLTPALDSRATYAALLRTVFLSIVVTLSFFGLESLALYAFRSAVPMPESVPGPVLGLGVAVLVAFSIVVLARLIEAPSRFPALRPLRVHLRNGLYANAFFDRLIGAHRV